MTQSAQTVTLDPCIDDIRAFNRFYTNALGVLAQAYLETPYTLTEARIIYELGAGDGLTAAALNRDLNLDPAYLSRILKKFRVDGLVDSRPDPSDQRSQRLTVTDRGQVLYRDLAQRARLQIARQLGDITPDQQQRIVTAMATIRTILDPEMPNRSPAIIRPHRSGDIGWVIQSQAEFYSREYGWTHAFEGMIAEVAGRFLTHFDSRMEHCWIAERGGSNIGSVFIANGGDGIAKLRLLYIAPAARGLGLGRLLVEECIRFSRQAGYRQLSLWTNDILDTARRIYQKAGFRLVAEEKHTLFGPELNGQTWVIDL